ncbi:hypothetical protein BASA81_016562 [Batrachochytrium salamandrivorans]|nr:hypothetical protein BASA81_016562 [Batrachochytrium salamandrivorans]
MSSVAAAQAKLDEIFELCDGQSRRLAQSADAQLLKLKSLESTAQAHYSQFRTAGLLSATSGQRLLDRNYAVQDFSLPKVQYVEMPNSRLAIPVTRLEADCHHLQRPGTKKRVVPASKSRGGRQISATPLVVVSSPLEAVFPPPVAVEEEESSPVEVANKPPPPPLPPAPHVESSEEEEEAAPLVIPAPPVESSEEEEEAAPLVVPAPPVESSDEEEEQPAFKPPPPPPKPVVVVQPPPPPKPVAQPPPEPVAQPKSQPAGDISLKRTQDQSEAPSRNGGGLAARQAMLAAMMGGGPKLPPQGKVPCEGVGGGLKSASVPKEVLPPPQKLNAAASSELSKMLGGGGSKDLSKYEKMKKTGLPQGAIEHAMIKDGVDPKLLFQ